VERTEVARRNNSNEKLIDDGKLAYILAKLSLDKQNKLDIGVDKHTESV